LTQEDEDIARALQESLKLSSFPIPMPAPHIPDIPVHFPIPSPSGPSSYESHLLNSPPLSSNHSLYEDVTNNGFTSSPPMMLGQISEDEALARRLAEEREEISRPHTASPPAASPAPPQPQVSPLTYSSSLSPPSSAPAHSPSFPFHSHGDTPPMYNDVITSAIAASSSSSSAPSASPSLLSATPSIAATSSSGHSRPSSALGRSTSATAVSVPASPSKHSDVRSGRSGSLDSAHSTPATSPHATSLATPKLGHDQSSSSVNGSSSNSSTGHTTSLSTVDEVNENHGRPRASSRVSDAPSAAPTSSGGANQYIDQELLRGVSLGFNPPVIRPNLAPHEGPIPNVIALPYGRCPPFHLKAPSWRDLIKLMARLSGTRLEPTIEAMAVVKTEMRLRVVANFVKVHQNTSDWHIVLYMTIDQPVPANHPQKFKYKNGDPNILPFSYTMSATPAYLREGADAPISKWYNIPSTAGLPHPKLPITFPDLATYLLDALEDSRRALHDGSGGMRRLAKLIETCYPADRGEERTGRERGVSNWVRGLIGRERARSRDRNEHTFDVVTPFVPDEWGG